MKDYEKLNSKPRLKWTIEDYRMAFSSPPNEIAGRMRNNPGKTHGELMTREQAVEYVESNRRSLVELRDRMRDGKKIPTNTTKLIEDLHGNVRYLHALGKLHHKPELVRNLHENGILYTQTEQQLKKAIENAGKKSELEHTLNDYYLLNGSPSHKFREWMRNDPTKSIGEHMTPDEAKKYIDENLKALEEIKRLRQDEKFFGLFKQDLAHLRLKGKIPEELFKILRKKRLIGADMT